MVKCKLCKKKLNPLFVDAYKCRCKGIFCPRHLQDHNCSFDFLEHNKPTTESIDSDKLENRI